MRRTFGIEEEYLLVDERTGELVARSSDVLAAGEDMGDSLSSELNQCQIEIATTVCDELAQAEAELQRLRAEVNRAGSASGTRAAALASHPYSSWYGQEVNTDKERYAQLEETYQRVAWEQAICGCHVHVGIEEPDERIAIMNRVRPWLPALLALSANSPFWDGIDAGYASYRTIIWKPWPTAAMPPQLETFADYEALVEELQTIEAIDSPKSLYWYVRPSSQFETLEFRVCDVCLRPADAVTIAGLIRGLVSVCAAEAASQTTYDSPGQAVLESALWRAARYGLDNTLVDPTRRGLKPAVEVIWQLYDFVLPGLEEAGDAARVRGGIEAILRDGNGAVAQRTAVAESDTHADAVFRIIGP